ncbi:DUF2529 family protein [Halalkalibacterium ligniniphilum]|uniref:DUF2529 family protein n=1 Tax=Halalkalibacterium ligniniphilum TaxID=1134413 RepID=UPI00034C1494|nr:DUF2529 family protein [Halalkalibacterium ligniniphilum]
MIQIFTTQLSGLLNQFKEQEELALEDGARMLAQALVGEGQLYIHGIGEMAAVTAEATLGNERLPRLQPLFSDGQMAPWTAQDRFLLFSRFSNDQEAIRLAKELSAKGAMIIAASTVRETDDEQLSDIVDLHLNLNVQASLVPTDDGSRIGYPATLVALYAYFCLYLTTKDILAEYE